LVVATFRWLDVSGTQERYRAPLSVHQMLLNNWLQAGKEVVILTETQEAKYGATEQETLWSILDDGLPVRVVNLMSQPQQGIPFAPDGEVLVSAYGGVTIPALFGEGEIAGHLSNGDPMFREVKVTPDMLPKPTILPQGSARFSNGARLLGFYAPDQPQPGKTWNLDLLWTTERAAVPEQIQFSIRLIDNAGKTYGQVDGPSLSGGLWQAGDTVLNRMVLPVGADIPVDTPMNLQVIMYTLPTVKNADVIDDAGNPLGQWALFPFNGISTH
jgi:hypothetical protein